MVGRDRLQHQPNPGVATSRDLSQTNLELQQDWHRDTTHVMSAEWGLTQGVATQTQTVCQALS